MKKSAALFVVVCGLMFGVNPAHATEFKFTDLNLGAEGRLSGPQTDDGVTATAWVLTSTGWGSSYLYLRNDDEDHGLGVCSENLTDCQTKGGDVNELSNQSRPELIRLELPANKVWTSLWVSSLDSGGSNSHEQGVLSWSNTADPNSTRLGSFRFGYGDFGGHVEGSLTFPLTFQDTAKYLFFTNNVENGPNNDYLVWKGTIDNSHMPEPASLVLLGTGLLSAVARHRRKSKR
jgi:hypothetical protein